MKKIIMTAASLLIAAMAFAQIQVGAGYLQQSNESKSGDNTSNSKLNGAYVGASYNVALPVAGLSVAPGIYYSFLTGSSTSSASILGLSQTATGTTTEQYINVPVLFNYGAEVGPGKVYCYLGPTVSYAIAGQYKLEGSGVVTGTSTTELFGDDSNYNPLDVKASIGVGFKYNGLALNVGFDWGLLDRDATDDTTLKTNLIHVGVGYSF